MVAAALCMGLTDLVQAQTQQFDQHTDWTIYPTHTPQCLPPGGETLREACCENYMEARISQDKAGLEPYYSFARLDIRVRIMSDAIDGLPIPDTAEGAGVFREIVALIDGYCEANPKIAFYRVMNQVWQDLPKVVETKGMAVEDLEHLFDTLNKQTGEETK